MFDQENEKQLPEAENAPIDNADEAEESVAPIPTEEEPSAAPSEQLPEAQEDAPLDEEALHEEKRLAEEAETLPPVDEPIPPATCKKCSLGSKIAAFFFFAVTVTIFALYQYCSAVFLYAPIASSPGNLGEAIAAIFGYLFGFVLALVFGVAQLPGNIVSIILFKRLRGRSDKKWENVLFTVGFILSILMLVVTLLSFALFIGVITLS